MGHTHGFCGFKDCGVDAGEADVGVTENGEERVENESDDGGAASDAPDEGDGDEEAEQGEARDGLKDAGKGERDVAQRFAMDDEHAEGHADGDGHGHGDEDKGEVIGGGLEDFGAMFEKKGPGSHACAPGSGIMEAVNARTSG